MSAALGAVIQKFAVILVDITSRFWVERVEGCWRGTARIGRVYVGDSAPSIMMPNRLIDEATSSLARSNQVDFQPCQIKSSWP
jgi:hypothetical protein